MGLWSRRFDTSDFCSFLQIELLNDDEELDYEDDSTECVQPPEASKILKRPDKEIGQKSPVIADRAAPEPQQSSKKRMISLSDGGVRAEITCPATPSTGSPKRKSVKDRLRSKDDSQIAVDAVQRTSPSIEQTPASTRIRDPRLLAKASGTKSGGGSTAPQSANPPRPQMITSIPRLSVTSRRPPTIIHSDKPEFRNVPPNIDRNAKLPSFLTTPTLEMYGLDVVFPHLCRSFASGNCFINKSRCHAKHEYPKAEWVAKRLEILSQEDVIIIFRSYILRNKNFIQRYFEVFCKYFGKHYLKDELRFATEHCQRAGMEPNLQYVVAGFMEFEMTYTAAILEAFQGFKLQPSTEMKFSMLDLILCPKNEEVPKFLRMLNILSEDGSIRFECKYITYLLNEYWKSPNEKLKATIWNILNKCESDSVDLEPINSQLIPFLEPSAQASHSAM